MVHPAPPDIVLLDFHTGRMATGHHEDYLNALEAALEPFGATTLAPFRTPQRAAHPLTRRLNPNGKLGRYLYTFDICRRLLGQDRPTLLIFHGPDLRDFLSFALAALFRPRSGKGVGVFVMRREPWAIIGRRGFAARLLEASVRWMARHAPFRMISDSQSAMRYWKASTGVDGAIVSIPVRRWRAEAAAPDREDAVVVGLVGGFRLEKGAQAYEDVIEAARGMGLAVAAQIGPVDPSSLEQPLAATLEGRWADDPQVRFHKDHLSADAFDALMFGVDIVVLPYDVESYGPGTSGIMFEAVAAGRLVVAARILWGVETYEHHPNLVWLAGADRASLTNGLEIALQRLRERRARGEAPVLIQDQFQESWAQALGLALAVAQVTEQRQ